MNYLRILKLMYINKPIEVIDFFRAGFKSYLHDIWEIFVNGPLKRTQAGGKNPA